ncbi:hypothetical protein FRC14_007856 [Serendipita sp. 396]|nr:hypothetical protein FRC14_007856 [Serendipita sp. 396]KAG8877021.1 hypothetical protein FRC20_000138 [Serendipita sp. 405]
MNISLVGAKNAEPITLLSSTTGPACHNYIKSSTDIVIMARLSFTAVLLAIAATAVNAQTTIANPFTSAGIPSLSDLPFCQNECAAVAAIQANWTGDYSSACTTTFANSLTTCMSCVANTSLGSALLTPDNIQSLSSAISSYTSACQQAGSPVTINLTSALAATGTATNTGTATGTGTATTPSNTSASSVGSNGAKGVSVPLGAAAVVGAALIATVGLF